jgi:hypothetical protein
MTYVVAALVDLGTVLAVDKDKVTPGLLGFVVVALLGLATYLLIRSMNREIKKIDLPDDQPPTEPGPDTPRT